MPTVGDDVQLRPPCPVKGKLTKKPLNKNKNKNKEGPRGFPVPSLLQQVPFCAAFDFGRVGICLVSVSDEQEMKFFSLVAESCGFSPCLGAS